MGLTDQEKRKQSKAAAQEGKEQKRSASTGLERVRPTWKRIMQSSKADPRSSVYAVCDACGATVDVAGGHDRTRTVEQDGRAVHPFEKMEGGILLLYAANHPNTMQLRCSCDAARRWPRLQVAPEWFWLMKPPPMHEMMGSDIRDRVYDRAVHERWLQTAGMLQGEVEDHMRWANSFDPPLEEGEEPRRLFEADPTWQKVAGYFMRACEAAGYFPNSHKSRNQDSARRRTAQLRQPVVVMKKRRTETGTVAHWTVYTPDDGEWVRCSCGFRGCDACNRTGVKPPIRA